MNDISAAAHPGTTASVRATVSTRACKAEKCETRAHIGIFFDGTGNNQDWVENTPVNWRRSFANWRNNTPRNTQTQLEQQRDSNVARLFRAYPDDPEEGYFRYYVNGLGTPFKDIGEFEASGLGAAFGAGGDGRINYGMLQVINAMYRAISVDGRPLIGPATILALCRNGEMSAPHGEASDDPRPNPDRDALKKVDMEDRGGLLMSSAHTSHRASFYTEWFRRLEQKIQACPKPKLTEVFIDVFGFSRGAAQARVFCNWLEPFFKGNTLAGVTTHIRFLGLFDTVAAVGLGPSVSDSTNGHQSWGDTPDLRISRRVQHCEHYVAMHENRGAFPLEDAAYHGLMPAKARQCRFPGMHSDVGGGYGPKSQGRGPDGQDADKLSQIPLNRMFDAAQAAKVPLSKRLAQVTSGWDCYEISPALQSAYDAFMQANGTGERPLKECLLDYLAWRYAVRHQYANLPSTQRASADDQDDLRGANRLLIDHLQAAEAAATIEQRSAEAKGRAVVSRSEISKLEVERQELQKRMSQLSQHATEIVQKLKALQPTTAAEAALFEHYCHDSYAGFRPLDASVIASLDMPGSWEPEGYLRYRVRFEGNNERVIQLAPGQGWPEPAQHMSA